MLTGSSDGHGPALQADLTKVGGALLGRRSYRPEPMLTFIGVGSWLFDRLRPLGVKGVAKDQSNVY
jgi:hypothetical protein